MRLALRLGYGNVGEMLSHISSRQMAEWAMFSQLEPWDERRGDLQAGVIAAVILNVLSGKNSKQYRPEDFLLFNLERRRQTIDEQRRAALFITQALGGKVLSGNRK